MKKFIFSTIALVALSSMDVRSQNAPTASGGPGGPLFLVDSGDVLDAAIPVVVEVDPVLASTDGAGTPDFAYIRTAQLFLNDLSTAADDPATPIDTARMTPLGAQMTVTGNVRRVDIPVSFAVAPAMQGKLYDVMVRATTSEGIVTLRSTGLRIGVNERFFVRASNRPATGWERLLKESPEKLYLVRVAPSLSTP